MLSVDEILATNIGDRKFEIILLESAASEKGAAPARCWASCKLYEALTKKGWVAEEKTENHTLRRWRVTDAGREVLAASERLQ